MNAKKNIWRKVSSAVLVSCGGFGFFTALSVYKENEQFYRNVIMPAVRKLDPETSHNIAIMAAKYRIFPKTKFVDGSNLGTEVWGLHFPNPVGMAAGFDKQGEAIHGLQDLGFGFVEVGSVTPLPQPGNPQPRVFRLVEDEAIINRFGFNSDGQDAVHKRLSEFRKKNSSALVGVNLGKNKESPDSVPDYIMGVQKFSDVADYLVINVSSPNTPGLRDLQGEKPLEVLLENVLSARDALPAPMRRPLLLKLAPDLTAQERKDVASVILKKKCKVDGLIVSNTTVSRSPSLSSAFREEPGGLSGKPLSKLSTHLIADMYLLTKGTVPIIGVGGISSGQDAYEKVRAGASLVQLYTAFTYHGPPIVSRIKRELDQLLREDGMSSVAEAVGKDAQKYLQSGANS
ncbi:dihydroorotate dehydrogenase (quinone), mitochondrial [Ischnura elegans]|uniref:dihydroorotate dehydrogenase (quinone), mitochondrial n=1 Tax=Ischnura elegans TaxID=197161 RepID=UPI001ED8BE2E|nr:dihydroorotate dehydrogenase (quinone), mitochondrial [Ischnura elegans]